MRKVTIYVVFVVLVAAICLLVGMYLRPTYNAPTSKMYNRSIKDIEDTIKSLKEDIVKYEIEISRLDKERESLRNNVRIILRDNEKIDSSIVNGDWDDNIRFLSDFLSEEDSMRK